MNRLNFYGYQANDFGISFRGFMFIRVSNNYNLWLMRGGRLLRRTYSQDWAKPYGCYTPTMRSGFRANETR